MSTNPDPEMEPEVRIPKIMTYFWPKLICQAEMWWQILDRLGTSEQITATLESLSPEVQAMIREYYRDLKPTYYSDYLAEEDRNEERALRCSKMIEWCEREPTPRPPPKL
jgi:hypothetical protein